MSVAVTERLPIMGIIFLVAIGLSVPVIKGLAITRADMKRYSNNALSPVLSNLGELSRGAGLIAAIDCRDFFRRRHRDNTDNWGTIINGCQFVTPVGNMWCHSLHQLVLVACGVLTF